MLDAWNKFKLFRGISQKQLEAKLRENGAFSMLPSKQPIYLPIEQRKISPLFDFAVPTLQQYQIKGAKTVRQYNESRVNEQYAAMAHTSLAKLISEHWNMHPFFNL